MCDDAAKGMIYLCPTGQLALSPRRVLATWTKQVIRIMRAKIDKNTVIASQATITDDYPARVKVTDSRDTFPD